MNEMFNLKFLPLIAVVLLAQFMATIVLAVGVWQINDYIQPSPVQQSTQCQWVPTTQPRMPDLDCR